MYRVEKNENRITIYKDNKEYLEWDDNMHTDEDTYILDHQDLWDMLPGLSEKDLDKILSCFNAKYNGIQYGEKQQTQLTIFDIEIPEEPNKYIEIDKRTGNKYIYHHTKDEVIKIKKSLGTFWFEQEENADGTLTLTETKCKVNGEIIYET